MKSEEETHEPTLAESRWFCEQLNIAIADAYRCGVDPESLLTVLMVAAANVERRSLQPGSAAKELEEALKDYNEVYASKEN